MRQRNSLIRMFLVVIFAATGTSFAWREDIRDERLRVDSPDVPRVHMSRVDGTAPLDRYTPLYEVPESTEDRCTTSERETRIPYSDAKNGLLSAARLGMHVAEDDVPALSEHVVMPVGAGFVGDVFAFPNPYVPSQGHTHVTFNNLGVETNIRIYTIAGGLVADLTEDDGDGQLDWDVRNEQGEEVSSGVYIYVIKSGTEKKIGRLVIIR